jgi:hypothetical protein
MCMGHVRAGCAYESIRRFTDGKLRSGGEKAVQNSVFSRSILGLRGRSIYNLFTFSGYRHGNSTVPFLYFYSCARPGPALSLAMFTTPHRAGQLRFVETAATPEDCCRRADDDSLSTQAPAWRDVAAVAVAVGDCRLLMATAASCGSLAASAGRRNEPRLRGLLLGKQS